MFLSLQGHTLGCQPVWLDWVMNVWGNAAGDSTGDIGVGQEKAILWAGMSQLGLDRKLNMIQSHSLINLYPFSGDKTRPTLPVGTENHWPVSFYEATPSIPSKNLAYSAMVGTTGATGLPRAPQRSLRHCKRKHPHLGEVKTCLQSRAFINLLLWLHTSSSSGMGNTHFTTSFLNQFKPVYAGHQKTKSSSMPETHAHSLGCQLLCAPTQAFVWPRSSFVVLVLT